MLRFSLRRAALAPLALLVVCSLSCSSDDKDPVPTCTTAGHPEDYLPTNVQGWTELAGMRETAATIPELQATVVNGGYQAYEYYGFQEFARAVYDGTVGGQPTTIDIRITELPTATAALAMYNDTQYGIRPPVSEPVTPPIGEASRLVRGISDLTLDFVDCAYWVKININDTSDDALTNLQAFAASVELEIEG